MTQPKIICFTIRDAAGEYVATYSGATAAEAVRSATNQYGAFHPTPFVSTDENVWHLHLPRGRTVYHLGTEQTARELAASFGPDVICSPSW